MVLKDIKKISLVGLALFVMFSSYIFASRNSDIFRTRGFYGGIQYIFLKDIDKMSNREKTSYIQIYQMGYESFIYNPKLVVYDISGALYFDKTKIDNAQGVTKDAIEDQVFNIRLDLIQGSKYPFTIYAQKQLLPTINLTGDNYIRAQDIYRYGIHGAMNFDSLKVRYRANIRDAKIDDDFYSEKNKNNNFSLSFTKRIETNYISLTLAHSESDYYRKSLDTNHELSRIDNTDDIKLSHKWSPHQKFRISSYIAYSDSKYSGRANQKRTTANVSVDWVPNRAYSVNFRVLGENLKDINASTNYVSMFAGGKYMISSKLTSTQDIQFYSVDGNGIKQDTGSVNFGLRYSDVFTEGISYFLRADTGLKVERGRGKTLVDTLVLNKNINLFNIGAGITKTFANSSTIGLRGYYYHLTSDLGDKNSRYTITSNYFTRLRYNLTYGMSMSYSNNDNTNYGARSGLVNHKSWNYNLTNRLNYTKNLGISGRFTAGTGFSYNYSDKGGADRFRPYLNMTLNYKLTRNLIFNSKANISQDVYADTTNLLSSMWLEYRIRKIKLLAGMRYSDRLDDSDRENGRQNIFAQFQRVF